MTSSTANSYVLPPWINVWKDWYLATSPEEVELGEDLLRRLRELPGGPPDVPFPGEKL